MPRTIGPLSVLGSLAFLMTLLFFVIVPGFACNSQFNSLILYTNMMPSFPTEKRNRPSNEHAVCVISPACAKTV
jgi:hypothetical protein